jgi:hypothetical protein
MHIAHTDLLVLLQAAYAYNMLSSQAATVVGAMDKMWSGSQMPSNGDGQQQQQGLDANALCTEQQQARLELAMSNTEDGDEVYVQVCGCQLAVYKGSQSCPKNA